jgi:hypothetical protein
MSRLSTHLPQLASLALAVIAAAVSHSVHVDRSASSRAGESRNHAAGPTAGSGKPRPGSPATGREAGSRSRRAARFREPPKPLDRPVVVTVSADPPRAPRPRHVDRLRAEPGVERGVDPDFEHLTDDLGPGVDSGRPPDPPVRPPTPGPAVPAPPVPTPPVPTPPVPTLTDISAPSEAVAPDNGGGAAAAPTTAAPGAANPDGETANPDPPDPGAGQQGQQTEEASPVAPRDPGAPMPPAGEPARP